MATMKMPCAVSGSGGSGGYFDTFTPTTSSFTEIELGFAPKNVLIYSIYHGGVTAPIVIRRDEEAGQTYVTFGSLENPDSSYDTYFYVSGTKVYYKANSASMAYPTAIMAY